MEFEPVKQGTAIHFCRAQEKGCRPGTLLSNSFQEVTKVPMGDRPPGVCEFGNLHYGEHPGSESQHTFEVTRIHDPLGAADTWHLAFECPFAK